MNNKIRLLGFYLLAVSIFMFIYSDAYPYQNSLLQLLKAPSQQVLFAIALIVLPAVCFIVMPSYKRNHFTLRAANISLYCSLISLAIYFFLASYGMLAASILVLFAGISMIIMYLYLIVGLIVRPDKIDFVRKALP